MCVALAVAASGARCSGQVVCVVPGRRGFGRKLAHGSAIAGERWHGSQFGEPDYCVWWVGSVLRRATDPVRGVPPQARTARRCTSSRYHRRLLPGSVPKGPSSCHRAVLAVCFYFRLAGQLSPTLRPKTLHIFAYYPRTSVGCCASVVSRVTRHTASERFAPARACRTGGAKHIAGGPAR